MGFPGSSDGKESACNVGDSGLIPESGRFPGEGNGNHSRILSGKSHGQKNLVGYRPLGHKGLDMTEQLTLHFFHKCILTTGNPERGDVHSGSISATNQLEVLKQSLLFGS